MSEPQPIPVQFADPELMRKIAGITSPMPSPAQVQKPADQFSFGSPDGFDTFEAPKQDFADMQQAAQPLPQAVLNQAPNSQQQPAPSFNQPNQPAQQPQAQQPILAMDSSNNAFNNMYLSQTPKQREIIDAMEKALNFKDLFTRKRFLLKSWIVIPGKLKLTLESMSQQELMDFWEEFNDVKGSQFYLDARLARKYCTKTVRAINEAMLPEDEAKRDEFIGSLDHAFIQIMFDYAKLFELARLKLMHSGDILQNPI